MWEKIISCFISLPFDNLSYFSIVFNIWGQIKKFAYDWQQLVGSLIGAAVPITLFIISERVRQKAEKNLEETKRKEHLQSLEKNIITAINNLSSIDKMLHDFVEITLEKFKIRIGDDNKAGRHSVGQVFVPLSYSFSLDEDLIKITTNSSFIENLVLEVFSYSKELPLLLQDISRQFDRVITFNIQIGVMRLNSASAHNASLLDNIKEFEYFMSEQTFGNNIPVYLKKLVLTQVALRKMQNLGLEKWKETFNFKSPFTQDVYDKMVEHFKPEANESIENLRQNFKSKLFLIEEQVG